LWTVYISQDSAYGAIVKYIITITWQY
jgi:hypothetical protein